MASLFDIKKVTVGEDKLTARVAVNPDMPQRTSEDIEATARVYYLAPGIAKHLCLGDAGNEFQDCMGDTEMAHLLEHVTVEIMNQTGLAGKIACGRTRAADEERAWDIELSCPDDVLTIGALSSATFMMDWAFLAADQPAPDFDGTVAALKQLVLSMRPADDPAVGQWCQGKLSHSEEDAGEPLPEEPEPASEAEHEPEPESAPAPEDAPAPVDAPEPEETPAEAPVEQPLPLAPEPEPAAQPEPAPAAAPSPIVSPADYDWGEGSDQA